METKQECWNSYDTFHAYMALNTMGFSAAHCISLLFGEDLLLCRWLSEKTVAAYLKYIDYVMQENRSTWKDNEGLVMARKLQAVIFKASIHADIRKQYSKHTNAYQFVRDIEK